MSGRGEGDEKFRILHVITRLVRRGVPRHVTPCINSKSLPMRHGLMPANLHGHRMRTLAKAHVS